MSGYIITKKTETDAAEVSLCSDGIVRVMFKQKKEANEDAFEALFDLHKELVEDVAYAYIYYAEDSSVVMTEDGRKFAKAKEHSYPKICNAVVVTNLGHKLLANFYLKFNKPFYPFKVFNKMEDAELWCSQQTNKNA